MLGGHDGNRDIPEKQLEAVDDRDRTRTRRASGWCGVAGRDGRGQGRPLVQARNEGVGQQARGRHP